MTNGNHSLSVLTQNKKVFIGIGVILLAIELTIFAVAALQSGEQYRLQFIDRAGHMVFESDGRNLHEFNKYHFEKAHGPLENYQRRLVKSDKPFPFRAWFVAAVGIPLGLVLCFVFILKAYTALFYGDEDPTADPKRQKSKYENRLEKIIGGVQKFNIFVVAAAIFLVVIAYWIIPNLVVYVGEVGIETVVRFRWVLVVIGIAAFALLLFVIYLKFLLAKKSMESQVEIDKHRMQLEYKHQTKAPLQLANGGKDEASPSMAGWDEDVLNGESVEEK